MVKSNIIAGNDYVQFLGLIVDKNLKWGLYIDRLCMKLPRGVFALIRLNRFCSEKVLMIN